MLKLFNVFFNDGDNTKAQRKITVIIVSAVFIYLIINSVLFYQALNKETIIIVPVGTGIEYRFKNGKAVDEHYLLQMTRYILTLSGDISASNVDNKYEELLYLAHPSIYTKFKEDLIVEADTIKQFPSISYGVQLIEQKGINVKYNGDSGVIRFNAVRNKYVGANVKESMKVNYEIAFSFNAAGFWLLDIGWY